MGRGIWPRRCKAPDLYCSVVAGGCEILVGRVERQTFDVTLMARKGLELLKGVA